MKALAIDTSNLVMGLAVVDGDTVIGDYTTNLKKNHSIRVMPAIHDLLKEMNMKPNQLDRIVVAKGPGSYTGVRIGVTIAKTLAWTLHKELVGVSSLEVLAQNGKYFPGFVCPLFDARRTQWYTGLYGKKEDGTFGVVKEDALVLRETWLEQLKALQQPVLFLGNDLPLHQEAIAEALGSQAVFGALADHNPRPTELAALGMMREPEDVHHFVPSYLQLAEAEANWLKAQNK
ncbi:Imetal-dependent protease putative molecular chaperone-like protein [Fictibacillus macauensis ZFHKF-1]|uniref:Imetal-dependent protease putative molecular chaperone-like protein n=1 Tax=Fictibacillus macauensis ZFHKF-1 TaxID=1196324 RepID=I8AG68_9BACL|nr:tRNA (adenosine(37)-N6)-threonylcarbamoyltransferase complex dimerization subunit type 1 TsaB [Fictibacillus macauensis]EIT84399.1 Imetal-dependent protease putative molecular chaperone-like protein [Fictibacillus macauensis ZFHKF-1]